MANVKDAATGTVLTAPSPATSGTSLVLNSGEGARFPTPPFYVVAHPNDQIPTMSVSEKLLVTAISTDTLTIVRAQGSYTAKSIAVGWRITNAIFEDDLNNASIVTNEVPTGTVDGSNTTFTVASQGKVTGSLVVYKNGVRMKNSGNDFTETSTGFTMVAAPATGTVILCDYVVAGAINNVGTNSYTSDESPAGSINGSNTTFTTIRPYISNSLKVYINGVRQQRGTDFTETTPGSGTFTLIPAPVTGDIVTVDYHFNLNPASNADTVDGVHANDFADLSGYLISEYYGWNKIAMTLTYASASTFTVSGNYTSLFRKGLKLWLTQTTSKYFYVLSSSHSSGTTTVTVTGGSDYTLANAAITSPYISDRLSPNGFPDWFNYTPTYGNLTIGNATVVARFRVVSSSVEVSIAITFGTTTSITSTFPTVLLPITPVFSGNENAQLFLRYLDNGVAWYIGNGVVSSASVALVVSSASGTYDAELGISSTVPFTFGNTDRIHINGFYPF